MSKVAVIGAGGHAKVIIDLLRASGHEVAACLDAAKKGSTVNGVQILGGEEEELPGLIERGVDAAFIAFGDGALRRKVESRIAPFGLQLVNAIGRSAVISPSVKLGCGIAVMEGAVINADASVADLAIINTNASVDHDCVIGAFSHVAPGCALAGGVVVGDGAFLGAGTRVIPGVSIAAGAVIGAGSVVVRNVDMPGTWVGVPARQIIKKD